MKLSPLNLKFELDAIGDHGSPAMAWYFAAAIIVRSGEDQTDPVALRMSFSRADFEAACRTHY
jgi:hypothetical protein